MNLLPFSKTTLVAAAGLMLALPLTSQARDHDGGHDRDFHGRGYDHGYYHRGYWGGGPFFYGGYSYWDRPYWYGPRVGVSYYGRPAYEDDLGVEVQRALRGRGFYRGPIDGDIGPGSRSAIRSYQNAHGLPVSGRIDEPLLRSLHLD